jgi:hypothetical protein
MCRIAPENSIVTSTHAKLIGCVGGFSAVAPIVFLRALDYTEPQFRSEQLALAAVALYTGGVS